jgi:hypothetical protein
MFRNHRKERELLDKELDLYRREKKLAIDAELEKYSSQKREAMVDMAKKCHEQLGEYEHVFHNTKEQKGIELAKLEAKAETLAETLKVKEEASLSLKALLESKDAEIKRLNDILVLLIKEQPKNGVTLQQLK